MDKYRWEHINSSHIESGRCQTKLGQWTFPISIPIIISVLGTFPEIESYKEQELYFELENAKFNMDIDILGGACDSNEDLRNVSGKVLFFSTQTLVLSLL